MKSFKNIMGASDDLNKRIEKIKQNVIKDPDVKVSRATSISTYECND